MNMNEEIICGFKVTEKRKRIWACQIEMVKICLDICKKYNLEIVASDGTLLGAIRHDGFIPWDDDIDLYMKRPDYEKFLDVVESEIPSKYFAQSLRTEKKYPNGHFQLRDNDTTCLINTSYNDLKIGKNSGVWVDIFPLDYVSDDETTYNKDCERINEYKKRCWWALDKHFSVKSFIHKLIVSLHFRSINWYIKRNDELCKAYTEGKRLSTQSLSAANPKTIWDAKLYEGVTYHKFEDIEIPIPVHYDEILKHEFGNYMELPTDRGGNMHGSCYFDLDKSWKEYKNISYKEYKELMSKIDY